MTGPRCGQGGISSHLERAYRQPSVMLRHVISRVDLNEHVQKDKIKLVSRRPLCLTGRIFEYGLVESRLRVRIMIRTEDAGSGLSGAKKNCGIAHSRVVGTVPKVDLGPREANVGCKVSVVRDGLARLYQENNRRCHGPRGDIPHLTKCRVDHWTRLR